MFIKNNKKILKNVQIFYSGTKSTKTKKASKTKQKIKLI